MNDANVETCNLDSDDESPTSPVNRESTRDASGVIEINSDEETTAQARTTPIVDNEIHNLDSDNDSQLSSVIMVTPDVIVISSDEEFPVQDNIDINEVQPARNPVGPFCYQCHECDETFGYIDQLVEHSKTHKPPEKPVFTCDYCDKNFESKTQIIFHIGYKHNQKRYECEYCPKKYIYKKSLETHVVTVHIYCNKLLEETPTVQREDED